MSRQILICILLLAGTRLTAQFYNAGADPASLKWSQIKSENFRVIYPRDQPQLGQRMTHILEYYYQANSACLGEQPKPVPVILHNQSVLSNGFVAWAPKRMELVTTPSAMSYSQDFLEQLALHEFRHVMEMDKLDQGFTKVLSWVAGEQATGAVAGLMPYWYLEGDAVDAETKLSHTGRGRLPSFEMQIKAILAEDAEIYSYDKAFRGSYKDYVPDHYQYGYQMVSYARKNYGDRIWSDVLDYTARNPYTLYPFYFGLKKYAGSSRNKLYFESLNSLKDHWEKTAEKRELSSFQLQGTGTKKHYSSYRFPAYINDSLIFAEKSGINQINEFVLISSGGHEKRLFRPGFYSAASISASDRLIVWAEIIRDLRWPGRSYSVIKGYDINSGQEKTLTSRSQYFAPDLSGSADRIVVVESDENHIHSLVILRSSDGEVLEKIHSEDNEFLQYPVWSHDDLLVYVSALDSSGKKIRQYNTLTGEWQTLFRPGFEDIAELSAGKDFLLFRGGFSGIDNIYALDLNTSACFRVTSSRFGACHPSLSASGNKLLYSEYSAMGFDLAETDFDRTKFVPFSQVSDHSEQFNYPDKSILESAPGYVPAQKEFYEDKPYRKGLNLFNFHSWLPIYFDYNDPKIEDPLVSPGISLISQNRLSTATSQLGYEYKNQEHIFHSSFIFTGLYPAFQLSFDFGGTPFVMEPPLWDSYPDRVKTDMRLAGMIYLPLNLTRNRFVTGIRPSVEGSYSPAYYYYNQPEGYKSGLTFIDSRLYFYSYLKTSHRDILPRLGLILDARFVDTPFEKEWGSQFVGQATVYLPGILPHQTVKIRSGYQQQTSIHFLMNNLANLPRGYHHSGSMETKSISLDYVFPVLYPDLRIWQLAYFKRVRMDAFYDYAITLSSDDVYSHLRSTGFELLTDVHIAQIIFPFSTGIRYIYMPGEKQSLTEFIFTVNLNQF